MLSEKRLPERKKLLIATANPGKLHEIKEILDGLDYEMVGLSDLGIKNDFVEEGDSHQEIAMNKALYFHGKSGLVTLADDSGIVVDALKTELGIKTRRWGAGDKATDEEWLKYFMKVMERVPDAQRTARFVCCACIVDESGGSHIFVGQTEGFITRQIEAPIKHGLPLSSVFKPEGHDKVYSALDPKDKNGISHRGKAVKAVREFLGKMS
ncbi:hypothetical protein KBB06_04570 [Candidatus Gracilibacteria bacterium]|nr:hypothetical protein [Candidatus Gracilibacteria bacterium]